MIRLQMMQLPHGEGLPLPSYAKPGDAGMDLLAAVQEEVTLHPGERMLIPTGICIAVPEGYEAQVRPRSGLALKKVITVLNTPGTIDAGYRGEIGVILINLSPDVFTVQRGDRIAQLVVAPVIQAEIEQVTSLDETERGDGGFGSTGT